MSKLDPVIKQIRAALPELPLLEGEPMSAHTSFRIGGPVRAMASPLSPEQTAAVACLLRSCDITPFVMGNGTNLLWTDRPADMFVIRMDEGMASIEREGGEALRCGAGAPLARIAAAAMGAGLGGFEFAQGIPGTLGGAVSMNAGAYGGEMRDVVSSVSFLSGNGELSSASAGELELSYRHSVFSHTDDIILGALISLRPDDPEAVQSRMRELSERRRSSQPLDIPSAGSTFKRPAGGYAAALIDQAGLKGASVGGAAVSEKHAGFVVNRGDASFDDVLRLIEHIRERVFLTSGVTLETEVKIIRG